MDFLLSKENLEFKEKARAIAEQVVRPNASRWDEEEKYPYEAIEALRKEGLMGVWIPKEYGGLGAGVLNLCIVVEELSRVDGGTGVAYAVNALASFPIIVGGTEEQKKKWLPDVASGNTLMAFALSEKEAGSDAGSLKATAKKDGDFYIIDGDKKWTTGAAAAQRFTVFAKTNPELGVRGISAFVVDRDTPGFTVGHTERKMGIR
ncbi:MAG: acyl-CoA dehydrogenase family protein, partial [bacterium]